jgi:putative FmdB family regulatory protein
MALYEYVCATHGTFSDWRPMKDSALDAPCPSCGAPSRRAVSVPHVNRVNRGAVRMAHERNEKSAHEPQVVRREDIPAMDGKIGHRHGGHAHGHSHGTSRPSMLGHAH